MSARAIPRLSAALRTRVPLAGASRNASSAASPSPVNDFVKQREAVKHHAAGSADLWRKITFYMAFPAVIIGYLNAESMMSEHHAHVEHMKEENGGEAPERIVYGYMSMPNARGGYAWGPNTLFHNPEINIDPATAHE